MFSSIIISLFQSTWSKSFSQSTSRHRLYCCLPGFFHTVRSVPQLRLLCRDLS